MSRFNRSHGPGVPVVRTASAVKAGMEPVGVTHQGGTAYGRDEKSELFILAVSNLVGQETFYEAGTDRDERYRTLLCQVTHQDPWFVAELATWLRRKQNLRTVAMITAAELAACLAGEQPEELRTYDDRGPLGPVRYAVEGALVRADEPGELIGYWNSRYPGTQLPKGLKRGIAAVARKLYTERNVLKWDSDKAAVRFADVLELTHPRPLFTAQGHLFKHLIDVRRKRDGIEAGHLADVGLNVLYDNHTLRWTVANKNTGPLALLDARQVDAAGMTWEDVLSLGGQHGLPKKELWEAIIPTMGYMALLRNLRNIMNAGVSERLLDEVTASLQDRDLVLNSRQLPLRFLSAHRATDGHPQWEHALGKALDISLENVPFLPGNTLIMVDTSGSMNDRLSARSDLKRWDAATSFGLALAARAELSTVVSFSGGAWQNRGHRVFSPKRNEPLLRQIERWKNEGYFLNGGTDTIGAVKQYFVPGVHDRLVILTDEQVGGNTWGQRGDLKKVVPLDLPTYTWNLAGYSPAHLPAGGVDHRWHAFGGLSDGAFKLISLLEAGHDAGWPWEV